MVDEDPGAGRDAEERRQFTRRARFLDPLPPDVEPQAHGTRAVSDDSLDLCAAVRV